MDRGRIMSGLVALTLLAAACGTTPGAPTEPTVAPNAVTSTVVAVAATTPPDDNVPDAAEPVPDDECPQEQIVFEHAPVDLDLIEYVMPLGLMFDSHVTPVDHQYFQNFVEPDLDIGVYSPAAGVVTSIQHMGQTISDRSPQKIDDYRLVVEHTCSLSSIFIHVGTLAPRLAAVAPEVGEQARVAVPVAAGETIGSFRRNVDYSVIDLDVQVPGLLVPEHYEREPWKIHTPDPFDYFAPAIRDAMVAAGLRSKEPFGGRFAYDVEGRLVGSWFLEGTNGYEGTDPDRYWAGHLAIAYDLIDPDEIVVSIGTFGDTAAQFGVRGNAPDPADVSATTGIIEYELVDYDYYIGDERWDRVSFARGIDARSADGPVRGVALFQLIADRRLRAEFFVGLGAGDVEGFTSNALTYER